VSLTYSNYLRLDELLSLQSPRSEGPEHDEMLFIVIHQVYELWFKEVLHELDLLAELFAAEVADGDDPGDTVPRILHTLKRVLSIFKTLVGQIDVLETMTPISFGSFRTRLEEASGFQSPQFRELELLLGQRDRKMLRYHEGHPEALERLERRLAEPSLYQSFLGFLGRCGHEIPGELLAPLDDAPPPEHPAVRAALLRVYRGDDRLAQVCERLVDLDEGLQEWRYRHVKMVERTIGSKRGTGGSSGVAYLRSTLFQPIFPDLWAVRAEL